MPGRLSAVAAVLADYLPEPQTSQHRHTRSQSERRVLVVELVVELQELRVEIQFFLLLLLREVVRVLEILVPGLLPLVVQVVGVQVVDGLVRMEHLDRVARAETGLARRVCKAAAVAVERVLLVRMEHLAYQVTVVLV